MKTYKELLQDLITFSAPEDLANLMQQLSQFDSDRADSLVNLSHQHMLSILARYLEGELTEDKVEEWANAVEIREDIELGNDNDPIAIRVIWQLANPLLTKPLTQESAQDLMKKLKDIQS